MWKNMPIILLVVVIAVIGVSDVSCASITPTDKVETVTSTDDPEVASPFIKVVDSLKETAENVVPNKVTSLFDRLTKKQWISISLIGAAILLTSSFAIHKAKNSPAKYDIVKEAKHISSVLGSSSGSTQEELDRITTALCTNLPGSPYGPPFESTTSASFTPNGDGNSNRNRTTKPATTSVYTKDLEEVCLSPAKTIVGHLKNLIEKFRNGIIATNVLLDSDTDEMHLKIDETAEENCHSGFFSLEDMHGVEGISFDTTNKFVNMALNDDACKVAAEKLIPILSELGHDSFRTGLGHPQKIVFETKEMETNFLEGEAIANNKDCGHGFFRITDNHEKMIQYDNGNEYISAAWTKQHNDEKCQQRADGVIALLKEGGHYTDVRDVTKTASSSSYDLDELRDAYALGRDGSCGSGDLSMQDRTSTITFSYLNTNPYIIKAWERAPTTLTCKNTGKDVMAYFAKLGLYSPSENASIIVPKLGDSIENLMSKILNAKNCNCKKGFFRLTLEDGNYIVTYNKNNPYIKPEWEKIDNNQLCTIAANGVYNVLKAHKKIVTSGTNAISLPAKKSVEDELKRKFTISRYSSCGDDFFTATYESSYIGIEFRTTNSHVNSEWVST